MPNISKSQKIEGQTDVTAESLKDLVEHHPFCAGLKPSWMRWLVECAALVRYPAHQVMFSEGAEAEHLYLVNRGQLALELFVPGSGVVPIQTVHEGEACGISALFGNYRWSFSAQTTQAAEVIVFSARSLRERARQDHKFEHELMARLAPVLFHRLRATRQRLIEFYGAVE